MTKERGLICCAESVQAFLNNRKSQTRRTKDLNHINQTPDAWEIDCLTKDAAYFRLINRPDIASVRVQCPYGVVGDRLWVRESYNIYYANLYGAVCVPRIINGKYLADGSGFEVQLDEQEWNLYTNRKRIFGNCSGRFMYKSLARIWLEIAGIRVERVQEISWHDAKAEGVIIRNIGEIPRRAFRRLWDSLNAKRGYSWEKNVWNWVLELKQIQGRR